MSGILGTASSFYFITDVAENITGFGRLFVDDAFIGNTRQ